MDVAYKTGWTQVGLEGFILLRRVKFRFELSQLSLDYLFFTYLWNTYGDLSLSVARLKLAYDREYFETFHLDNYIVGYSLAT